MKRLVLGSALALLASGCATSFPVGGIYTEIALPVNATSAATKAPKEGTASCKSILSLVALGDCSIETAKKAGNITEIQSVDWHAENILGIIGKYKVVVRGQ